MSGDVPLAPMRLASLFWFVLAAGACAAPAGAHPLAPSLLELRELPSGDVAVLWKTPLLRAVGSDVRPELPARCASRGEPSVERDAASVTLRWTVRCGEAGLVGATVAVRGLERSGTNALVRVALADGRAVSAVLQGGEPGLVVPERQPSLAVISDYLLLGAGHILTGPDHLLFVLGLVLLVTGSRLLLYTVTAFTLGHSVTLSMAALGFVRFPSDWIEVGIAATLVVLAAELAREVAAEPSLLRRRPWLMAFFFGLLHGFGFAGALARVGLPSEEIPLALLSFNLGIELGQILFVGVVLGARSLLGPLLLRGPVWLFRAPAYAIGSLAAYWCLERALWLF
jgi:hydrogenase/urease accessory protein HupE